MVYQWFQGFLNTLFCYTSSWSDFILFSFWTCICNRLSDVTWLFFYHFSCSFSFHGYHFSLFSISLSSSVLLSQFWRYCCITSFLSSPLSSHLFFPLPIIISFTQAAVNNLLSSLFLLLSCHLSPLIVAWMYLFPSQDVLAWHKCIGIEDINHSSSSGHMFLEGWRMTLLSFLSLFLSLFYYFTSCKERVRCTWSRKSTNPIFSSLLILNPKQNCLEMHPLCSTADNLPKRNASLGLHLQIIKSLSWKRGSYTKSICLLQTEMNWQEP